MLAVPITAAMEGLRLRPWWAATDSPPLGVVIQECLAAKERANRRPLYLTELRRSLTKFMVGREGADPRLISPADLEAFFLANDYSMGTRLTMISRLSTLFGFAQKRGYIEHNPALRLERPVIEQKAPMILSPAEASTLLEYAGYIGMLAYVVIGMFVGVRPVETERLSWADIDAGRGIIRVDAAASKVRRRRIIQVEPNVTAWLQSLDQSKPITPPQKRAKLRSLAMLLKLDYLPHDCLRHTAASYLMALHKDSGKVATHLGNSPGVLLARYYQLVSPDHCAAFWNILPP